MYVSDIAITDLGTEEEKKEKRSADAYRNKGGEGLGKPTRFVPYLSLLPPDFIVYVKN